MKVSEAGNVKFGWRIPSFPVNGSKGSDFIEHVVRYLKEIEGDFDSAWISDHFVPWADFVRTETDTLECWTTLSHLAGFSKKLDFGTVVLCNSYRNPALLAKMGATLQTLTGGRLILGIGAGWKEDEHRAYGYDFPEATVRIRQLEESVQIIRRMWTEDVVTFRGKYFRVEEAYCNPKPEPCPPIMIGGGGEKLMLRVVARHADWWNFPNGTVAEYRHKLEVLKAHCSEVGRDYDKIKKTWAGCVAIAKTSNEALEIAYTSPFINEMGMEEIIVGSPEQVLEKAKTFGEMGVEYFILRFLDFPSTSGAKLFVEEVIPRLK